MDLPTSQDSSVDGEEARRLMRKSGLEVGDEIQLGLEHYREIAHELWNETLVFTPAWGKERRLVVQLGPPSDIPRVMLLQKTAAGWMDFIEPRAYVL